MIVHEGHTSAIYSIAFSSDGGSVVSGSGDNTIRRWDVQSPSPIGEPLRGHSSSVSSVSYSPIGTVVASGSIDKTIRLWDTNTGQQLGQPLIGDNWLLSVAFSPNSKLIASGYGASCPLPTKYPISLWDVQTRKAVSRPFEAHTGVVRSVSFSLDGTRLVSGSYDMTIRVWDVESGLTILGPLEGHTEEVRSTAFSHDGAQIISCSDDGTLRLWDAHNGESIGHPFKGHVGAVYSADFSPRGIYVASGGYDNTVRLWDIRTSHQAEPPFEEHTDRVYSVAFSPRGDYIASGSRDCKVIIRNIMGTGGYPEFDHDYGHGDVVRPQVTSQLSIQNIFEILCRAGCVDLSSQVDTRQGAAMVVSAGGFGDTWKGERLSGGNVAIKAWRTGAFGEIEYKRLKRIARELYARSRMNHPHIHQLQGVILFRDQYIGMVSEWMDNGNLYEYLRKHPDADRYQMCTHVALGLEYTHGCGMVHGDLKAINVLVSSDGIAKLSNFDSSIIYEVGLPFTATGDTLSGSLRWTAPEIIHDETPRTTESDMYALGMTMLEIYTADVPYSDHDSDFAVLTAVIGGTLPARPVQHIKNDEGGNRLWKLLLDCWSRNPSQRPSIGRVIQVLKDSAGQT